MQIPDAVYHLMRNTELVTCNLSGNVLKSVSPKFSQKFSTITGGFSRNNIYTLTKYTIYITLADLNLSHNKLSRLPEEFAFSRI